MPGRLMAEQHVANDQQTPPVKSKLSKLTNAPHHEASSSPRSMEMAVQNTQETDTMKSHISNGVPQASPSARATSNEPPQRLPPELEHITQGFQPLSKIFGRAAQESFNSLTDLISTLAEMESGPQTNGATPANQTSASPEMSVKRRLQWLEWAHTQRQKFMQLLVILQWSRRAPDVSRLIDVNWWIVTQEMAINKAWEDFGNVKRGATSIKIPGPNIATALEMLRGQQNTALPDLDFIPEKPLPPSQIMETIRNLNVLLHIRLNLHEELPEYLQDYHIHDGKVTFTVAHEFEVDLIIADEDPTSQFWFVDFRLLFSSISEMPTGNLEGSIRQRVDDALGSHGLVGCFEALHEFCLTLKISMLRQQAITLSRAAWAGFLKIDQHNRSLVIQYWCGRSGKKSWIQVGAKRGTPPRTQQPITYWPSKLTLKWTRDGKETPLPVDIDMATADIEHILKCVIAQHISFALGRVKQSLDNLPNSLAASRPPVPMKSDTEPSECTLHLNARSRRSCSVLVEPISGRFVLQPATSIAARFENEVNASETAEAQLASITERWLAKERLSKVKEDVKYAGFRVEDIPGADRESTRKLFGADTIEVMFVRKQYWKPSGWYITFAAHSSTESAWVARLATQGKTTNIRECHKLDGFGIEAALKYGPDWSVESLEQAAVARITREALQRRLRQAGVDEAIVQGTSDSSSALSSVAFDIGLLLRSHPSVQHGRSTILASDRVVLALCGFKRSSTQAHKLKLVAKGRLQKSIAQSTALGDIEGSSFSFAADGMFAFAMESDLGSSEPVDRIASSITALDQLGIVLRTLRKQKMQCQSARLDGVTFKYAGEDSMARVAFTRTGRLQLEQLLPASNPHHRIARRLNDLFKTYRGGYAASFDILLRTLVFTLPLLRALENLGQSDEQRVRVQYFPHDLTTFVVLYDQLGTRIRIDSAPHKGVAYWSIELSLIPQRSPDLEKQQKFNDAFKALCSQRGEGWSGNRTGIVATPKAMEEVIPKIDAASRDLEDEAPKATGNDAGQQAPQQASQQPPQQPPQPPSQQPPQRPPQQAQQQAPPPTQRPAPNSQSRPAQQQNGRNQQSNRNQQNNRNLQNSGNQQNSGNAQRGNQKGNQGAEVVVID